MASIGMLSQSCLAAASWSGWNGANGRSREGWDARDALSPPRSDRQRAPLLAVHRRLAERLQVEAISELMANNAMAQYRLMLK